MKAMLSLQGVHGGCGVTTMVAALGHALHMQGERVLVVDANPDNLLGLHLGMAVDERRGWARAQLDGSDWRDAAFEVAPGFALLPYGALGVDEVAVIEQWLQQAMHAWAERRQLLATQFDWVLFDLPQRLPAHADAVNLHAGCNLPLRLAMVDPVCHVLLQRQAGDRRAVVANGYDPAIPLQRDLMRLWEGGDCPLVPQPLHADASVPSALACKQPLAACASDSQTAADIVGLALWCMATRGRQQAMEGES